MIIPQWPNFSSLSMRMKKEFLDKSIKCPLIVSDYSFTNLLGWNLTRHYRLSNLHGNILIKFERQGKETYLPPIGCYKLRETLHKMIDDAGQIVDVPGSMLNHLDDKDVQIMFDRDNSDYIMLNDDLAHLRGGKFSNRRHLLNVFNSRYDYDFKPLTSGMIRYVIRYQNEWYRQNRSRIKHADLDLEHKAAIEVLHNYNNLNLIGGVIFIKGKIAGYIIGEILNKRSS